MDNIEIRKGVTTLVDLTEEAIVNYIKSSDLTLGDKFPFDEKQLSEKLNVSRNVVREALSRLQSFGIIESRKRNGIVIREPSMKTNLNRIIDPRFLSKDKILDLLELRYVLEIGIIPSIFTNIKDNDIDDLEAIIPYFKGNHIRLSIEEEINFHSRIYKITNNQIVIDLQEIIIPLYRFIHDNYSEFDVFNQKIRGENLIATHFDIIEALKEKNQEKYTDLITRHLMAYQLYIKEHRKS